MTMRDGRDAERRLDDRIPFRGGLEAVEGIDREGGGMTARWRARLRLQRDQRSGVKDRRQRPRPGQPDRRIA